MCKGYRSLPEPAYESIPRFLLVNNPCPYNYDWLYAQETLAYLRKAASPAIPLSQSDILVCVPFASELPGWK
jgi:hypothetical protein